MIDKSKLDTPADSGSPYDAYMRAMITQVLVSMVRNLRDDQLTMPQLAALHLLDQHKQMRIGELAEQLLLPLPAASRMASEMVAKGFVEREEDAADRRAKTLSLTPQGSALMEVVNQRRNADAMKALSEMDTAISEKVIGYFGEMVDSGLLRAEPK